MVETIKRSMGWVLVATMLAFVIAIKVMFPTKAHAEEVAPAKGPSAAVLLRAGLSPEALAATGLSSSTVTSVVTTACSTFNSTATALAAADADYATARTSYDALQRKVQSGLASQEEVTNCATAKTTLTSAETNRKSKLDAIFAAATANLSDGQKTTLNLLNTQHAAWPEIPWEYLAAARSQSNWVALRDALACKRIAEKNGEELDQASATLLTAVSAESAIATAKTNLTTYKADAVTAWNTAQSQ